jgi:hypothetical protein
VKRHPFDVEILRIPPGSTPYPFHSHSAQWEFYHLIQGNGKVRHALSRLSEDLLLLALLLALIPLLWLTQEPAWELHRLVDWKAIGALAVNAGSRYC